MLVRRTLPFIESLSLTELHLRIPFGCISCLIIVASVAKSIRSSEQTRFSGPHSVILLTSRGALAISEWTVRAIRLSLVAIAQKIIIVWHALRCRCIGCLLNLADQLLENCILRLLAWLRVWCVALVVLLDEYLSHVCNLVHIVVRIRTRRRSLLLLLLWGLAEDLA